MSPLLLALPFAVQGLAMAFDEGWFHRRRGLPRWERIGHPLDTLLFGSCFAWLVVSEPSTRSLSVFAALSVLSCVFVTKDEFVHKRLCSAAECWLHAVLFLLHPIVLGAAALLWWSGSAQTILRVQLGFIALFFSYQAIYWGPWNHTTTRAAAP